LEGVRKNVFLTTKCLKRPRHQADDELTLSLKRLNTDHVDLRQMHDLRAKEEIARILGPGGAMEASEAAKKAGKCRDIGFTGHFDPATQAAMLRAYGGWDSVRMPLHAADHAYESFEKTGCRWRWRKESRSRRLRSSAKLRALSPCECQPYTLSLAGSGCSFAGAERKARRKTIFARAQSLKKMTPEEMATLRKRAIVGQGV
jgi:uncharacterized protein